MDLGTCRGFHMGGEGPIPWTAMQTWADWWGITDLDDRALFCRIIRRLDSFYLDYRAKESEARHGR